MEKMEYIKIPLHGEHGKGKYALVDGDYDGEYFSQYRWYLGKNGYVIRSRVEEKSKDRKGHVYLHREVRPSYNGLWVDHINRNKLDNRSCNLRLVTPAENAKNRGLPKTVRKEGRYRGVTPYHRTRNDGTHRWTVLVGKKWVGSFEDPIEAAHAYDKAAISLYGDEAITNFLQ